MPTPTPGRREIGAVRPGDTRSGVARRFRPAVARMTARRIEARLKPSPTDPAAEDDFSTGGPSEPPAAQSIYTLARDRQAWVSVDVPWRETLGEPFAYRTQFDLASAVVRTPLGGGAEGAANVTPVFSIGRCGSTLLARLLSAAGQAVVSEPDAFTALGDLARSAPNDPVLRAEIAARAGEAFGEIGRALGPVVVKLRSQASVAAPGIAAARPRRAVFVSRDWESWRRSMARAFPSEPPETTIDYLVHGLRGIERAAMEGAEILHVSYGDLVADPSGTVSSILGRPVSADLLARAARADSQRGTPLAVDAMPASPSADLIARYDALWAALRDERPGRALGLDTDLIPTT